ncbi:MULTISPECIES: RhuM family protein [Vibrio]|uniref:Fic/DOC family protein n=1 Tax=Vibrio tasmaniensis TaxID=212663 RepID=A0A2N7ND33_9VIBR|nr:RhuM family protein [Vibrio tasmaniensis]PMO89804.1 hypothetical protein BCT01_00550 [Vibrio tasmaniensis]PMP10023.1 hypothetical protein BCS92_02540 [Vibrio tasmaniensis]TKG32595.1 Fic/DOC family protein [Vibrio tasmaniensis]TKG41722.1 Fic/DOC family protein [Vibrio tasmaniensis]TKG52077.1 Fic/DOC family protein [Vibrio tasmaniensis]
MSNSVIDIFESKDGEIRLEVNVESDTTWLSQAQICHLFGRERSVITKHVNNVFKEGELEEKSNVQNMHIANSDKPVKFYSLDVVISVGYRVKSKVGVQFRQWATKLLKEYLIRGYAIDSSRLESNAQELEAAIKLIQRSVKSPELTLSSSRGIVDIISRYTSTFLWLQRYDEGLLTEPRGIQGGEFPSTEVALQALSELKVDLMAKGEATELFARDRGAGGLSSIFGNLNQSVFGEDAYPTIESKAAHLLYFCVKNHVFNDGNKRSAAFLFADFLHRNNRLYDAEGSAVINDSGLAALTLLVAESEPSQKDTIIRLIMNMLAVEK